MNCCCPHAASASRLFSLVAGSYYRRFRKRRFEASQEQLLEGLAQVGYGGASLLEIGCGVGALHQELLEKGAARATGIDLAPRMIEKAEQLAAERGLEERTEYIVGDFMALGERIAPAEVTLLDKVVCCYPDADGLVHASLARTGRVYALTYPRDRWYVRIGVALGGFLMWLIRSDFRPYLHDPRQVGHWIRQAGFVRRYRNTTWVWLTEVYEKPDA